MFKFVVFAFLVVTFSFPLYYDADRIFTHGPTSREPAQAPFHSATEEEMANPRCVNQDHVRRNNVQNFLKKYSDLSNVELPAVYEVAGIRFEDEHPELIYRFMQLVTLPTGPASYFANVNYKEDQVKKAFGEARGCTKVLCAVQRIFGQEEGPLILLLLTEYDLNLSHLVWGNADKWKASEIRDVMKAIEAVPSFLLPLDLNQKMTHFKRGYGYANGEGTIANASIEVFDVWNNETQPVRQYSIYHEFGHNWAALHSNSMDVSPEWLRVSGWESSEAKKGQSKHDLDWRLHPGSKSVSIYAKTNPFEDFAESVSAYRYAPQRLKQVSAEKYKFVKDVVYGGIEFTGACPDYKQSPYEKDFLAFDGKADAKFVTKISGSCFNQNLKMLEEPSLKSGFLSCLSIEAAKEVLNQKGMTHEQGNNPLALYNSIEYARVRFPAVERAGVSNLKDLVAKVEKPHMKAFQEAVQSKDCDHAFDYKATEAQAKELGVEKFQIYFAVQKLNKRICRQYLDSGERRVTADNFKEKLGIFF
ncbi:hypothetical protein [Bdellovibrio sp. NC01]|uniref:hypothetical protein n=1 Tax=Bdellovibrio sp. NC01 TaxID=2220073 RepID=UPI001159FED9|nr:hypothetical protein [Bdellovibrio sp. NC01]QDK36569.1 hypothetical protein DOE51_02620 [Bdellovibrio sp. NC01]